MIDDHFPLIILLLLLIPLTIPIILNGWFLTDQFIDSMRFTIWPILTLTAVMIIIKLSFYFLSQLFTVFSQYFFSIFILVFMLLSGVSRLTWLFLIVNSTFKCWLLAFSQHKISAFSTIIKLQIMTVEISSNLHTSDSFPTVCYPFCSSNRIHLDFNPLNFLPRMILES